MEVEFEKIGGDCAFCGKPAVSEVRKGIAPNTWVNPIKICEDSECLLKALPEIPKASRLRKSRLK